MDELENLEELFDDLDFDEPNDQHLANMYRIFQKNFGKEDLCVDTKQVKINKSIRKKYPFKGKMETFVHIITRESKMKGQREFERDRANRIHWIRPILENADLAMIKVFRKLHVQKKQWQQFFWFEDKDFVVIVREIQPDFLLITAFCVDKINKPKYKKWYAEYKKV